MLGLNIGAWAYFPGNTVFTLNAYTWYTHSGLIAIKMHTFMSRQQKDLAKWIYASPDLVYALGTGTWVPEWVYAFWKGKPVDLFTWMSCSDINVNQISDPIYTGMAQNLRPRTLPQCGYTNIHVFHSNLDLITCKNTIDTPLYPGPGLHFCFEWISKNEQHFVKIILLAKAMVSWFPGWRIRRCNKNSSGRKRKVEAQFFFILASRLYLWNYWTHKNGSPIEICRILSGKQLEYFQKILL